MTPVEKILTWFLFYIASSEVIVSLSPCPFLSLLISLFVFNVNFRWKYKESSPIHLDIMDEFYSVFGSFLSQFIAIHLY